jgi:hypothetical protein
VERQGWESLKAIALKKGKSHLELAGLQEMGVFRCDGCGEEFVIGHPPQGANPQTAQRQACWLEEVLAEEHELEKKHAARIELPDDAFLDWRHGGEQKRPA